MPQNPDDPYGLGIQPLGASGRTAPPSEDDPYGLGIQPLGGVGRSGGRQQPEESHWYDNILTAPNAIRFGGSLAGDYAGGLLAPVTAGISYPVLSFLGGALGELGGQIAGGEDLNLWTAGTEGALNLVPGPNIPGERALLGDVVKYGAKSALSGAGQGILGTNPRKWAQEGMFNDEGNVNWATPDEYAGQATSGALFGGLTGAALAGGKALNDRIPSITKSQDPMHGLKMIGEGTHDNWVEPDSIDWRNPKEADIQEGEVIPNDAPPYEPWRRPTPPTEPPPPPPPPDPAGNATIHQPEVDSPFGPDEVAVGDSFDVPDLDVTNEYIDQMRDMGFERAGKLPGGRTLFQRVVSKLGEEKGSTPSYLEIWRTLNMELGRPPSEAEIEARQGIHNEGLATGEPTGEVQTPNPMSMGVARFPTSATDALQTILQLTNTPPQGGASRLGIPTPRVNEAAIDKAAEDFTMQVNRMTDPGELSRLLQMIGPVTRQNAITRGLSDVVRVRLNQVGTSTSPQLPQPAGPNIPAPPPNRGFELIPGGRTTETGVEDLRAGNVSQFPVQPSVEDRQVESFHKGMMGDVATRAAQMQQRVAELQQKYPNVPVEWIQRIQVAERNIARHLQSPRVDSANVQQMIADNQRRIDILTERMEAYNNAYMGGPSGLVPTNRPTESGIENLRPQAVLGDEWGPITPGHAESLLPQQPRDGEILPPEQSTETDMFGFPKDRDLTDEEVAQAKRAFLMRENLGPDMVENQQFLDDATGTIGDEKLHYPGIAEGGEKNITPTGMEPYRPPVQTGEILPPAATDYGPNAQAFLMRLKHTGVPLDVTDMTRLKPFLDSLDDPNRPVEGDRDEPSFQRARRPYEDLTPDVHKRYQVFDENDNLIHATYDRDEAHRIADENNGSVDDIGDEDKPMLAKVAGGGLKVDADIRRTAINITKDYTSPLPGIMAREGVQNTLDAADKVPGGGVVRVRLTDKDAYGSTGPSTIEMHDNGSGMNEEMLAEKLVRLFASGKENEAGATGGKGIGSASYILGGEHFKVDTVAVDGKKKYRIVASGTPEQFLGPNGSDYSRTEVPMSTPTSTSIKITLKDNQDVYSAIGMVRRIAEHSRGRKSKIIFDQNNYSRGKPIETLEPDPGIIDEFKMADIKDDKLIGDFSFKDSNIKIAIPDFDATKERKYFEVHYLNNGMYQFSENKHLSEKAKGIPENVIVNIEPQMDEQEDNYPFINTREDVKKDMREHVSKYIDDHISSPAINKKKNRTQELYDSMPVVPIQGGSSRKTVIFDPGERFHRDELKSITNSPVIQELMQQYDRLMQGGLNIIGRNNWNDRLEGIGLVFDPNMHGVHIPNPATKKSTILLNPFIRMEQGMTPEDNAFDHTITMLHEIAHIGSETGFQVEAPPMSFDVSQPRYGRFFASYFEQIRSHGDVSWPATGHDVGFIQRLGEVYAKMGAANTFATADRLERVFTGGSRSGQYSPELQRILQLYTESRGRPETTEDLLSGTGVKQANSRSTGKRSLPPLDSPVGTGTPAGTAIELFRRNLPAVTDYETTRFILPDGHRVGFKGSAWGSSDYHSPAAQGAGVPMDEALENGIVRFRPSSQNVAAEVHAPITPNQAVHLADSLHMLDKPYLVMEVMAPSGQRQHTIFEQGTKPGKIREWVNNIFRKLSDETGAWNMFGRQSGGAGTPPPQTPNYNTGGAAPPPPPGGGSGGLGGSGSTPGAWGSVKQATGWGSGGKVVQNKQQLNWIKEAMAVPAGATTTMDLSAPFRQGLSMINTPQFWKAAYKMFGGLTEAGFNQIDRELRNKPVMQARRNTRTGKVMPSIAQEAGLKMFETAGTGGMNQRAQATASRWLEEGIGQGMGSKAWKNTVGVPIRMSNRAYITFLNHLKVNRFEYLMDLSAKMHQDVRATGTARPGLFRQKFTQAEGVELNGYRNKVLAREIADFVNTATGQGPLKTHVLPFKQAEISLEGAAEALQHTFFSPGLIASRVRMLNPSTYVMASPFVRKQYMGAALATGAAWMGALGMIKAGGGDDVEVNLDNLTSADFGKAKIGDMRMDPGGGFQQFLVAMGRMIQGGTTSSASNEWQEFGKGFNAPTQKSNIERFLSNKLNPVTKFAYDLAAQSEYNPFHVGDRTAQLFVPLVIQDLIGLYQENPKLLPWMGPVLFGMGTQTYGRGESVGKLINPENDWLATGGGVKDLVTSDQENY